MEVKSNNYKSVLKSYFKENSVVESQISSFNHFVGNGLREIIMSFSRDNVPEYLLEVYDEVNLKIGDTWLGEPKHIEVDGAVTDLTPQVARLRGLTYSAPLYMKVETTIGTQKEEFDVQIAKLPIMLKSDKCVLKDKTRDELIELGEDPFEPGGYFIVNGTEKVIVLMEDLALNKFFIEDGSDGYEGRMFSERGVYKSLQSIQRVKDGSYTYTFGNFKNIPIFLLIKSLGIVKDKDIVELTEVTDSEVIFQMSEYSAIQDVDEAIELLSKKFNLVGSAKEKGDRVSFYLNNFVLPHAGIETEDRVAKARLICKLFKRYYNISTNGGSVDDKDHLGNKRVKLTGQLFEHLFVNNFNDLIVDILTNFQRMIKRGRFSSMRIIIREQLLSQKINSALAMGTWSDGRKGISQYLKRGNFFDTLSHLTRVVSPLSTSQENFKARELHTTHFGRLCPVETPEGHSIGLRKNLTLMSTVTYEKQLALGEIVEKLEEFGLNR